LPVHRRQPHRPLQRGSNAPARCEVLDRILTEVFMVRVLVVAIFLASPILLSALGEISGDPFKREEG